VTASAQANPPAAVGLPAEPVSMKPVFSLRFASEQAPREAPHALFASSDAQPQLVELDWIGDIHMPPVFPTANTDFLLNPRTDLKASAITETPENRDNQEPAEMAAFRFQR
jgi:hypothetical protein